MPDSKRRGSPDSPFGGGALHAESWDRIDFSGSLALGDAAAAYRFAGKTPAVAVIGRDQLLLRAEAAMERGDEAELAGMIPGIAI